MRNKVFYTPLLIIGVVALLMLLSLVRSFEMCGVEIKRINIVSDIFPFEEESNNVPVSDSVINANVSALRATIFADLINKYQREEISVDKDPLASLNRASYLLDYSADTSMMKQFVSTLRKNRDQPVRIAVMGDSFIEGDIFTSDLRHLLQRDFSGVGEGFMPIASPVRRYHSRIEHRFSGDWKSEMITHDYKQGGFLISGLKFIPQEGSWVEYKNLMISGHREESKSATLFFVNRGNAKIEVSVNGESPVVYTPKSGSELQSINIDGSIRNIRYAFSNVADLTVYGVTLDGSSTGVVVDNYSVRGNLGHIMSYVNIGLSQQYSAMRNYDLIILEYGVNIINKDRESYVGVDYHFKKLANHIKRCYPDTPILIMGLSERSELKAGKVVVSHGVDEVNLMQRRGAQQSQVLYWNTIEVMRNLGGMSIFVENRWAGKDYTHLTGKGGYILAKELYNEILYQLHLVEQAEKIEEEPSDTHFMNSL